MVVIHPTSTTRPLSLISIFLPEKPLATTFWIRCIFSPCFTYAAMLKEFSSQPIIMLKVRTSVRTPCLSIIYTSEETAWLAFWVSHHIVFDSIIMFSLMKTRHNISVPLLHVYCTHVGSANILFSHKNWLQTELVTSQGRDWRVSNLMMNEENPSLWKSQTLLPYTLEHLTFCITLQKENIR